MKRLTQERIRLVGYNAKGKQVLKQCIEATAFYERSHPVLDETKYRKARGIVRLRGTLYDKAGSASQEFEVRYDVRGAFLSDAAWPRGNRG